MFAIDDALAEIVASTTQPALGAIRLAWWGEALTRLDSGVPPPEPRLRAASAELLSRGVSGARLATLGEGWAAMLEEEADFSLIAERGAALFAVAATLLGCADPRLAEAGRLYALADGARRGFKPPRAASDALCASLKGHRFAPALRPLTALARLGARDLRNARQEPEANPARAIALLAHRFSGFVV
ncbi:MAG TPA: hypothetical protein VNI79_05980 [Sphingomicrobium sp.]|nr:hypothetical protein [Sphingomicrobium sp.]